MSPSVKTPHVKPAAKLHAHAGRQLSKKGEDNHQENRVANTTAHVRAHRERADEMKGTEEVSLYT
jgi:hypothetical protein